MLGIKAEGAAFLEAVLAGMILYCAYTCIRLFRRIVHHTLSAIAAEDFLFWTGTAVYLFVQIYHTSNGSIRWYFILGVVAGGLFFYQMSKFISKVRKKMYGKKKRDSKKSIE